MVLAKNTLTKSIFKNDILGFKYIEAGEYNPETIVLLHGLFGTLSNWENVISHFSEKYRVIVPILPIYETDLREANLESLLVYLEKFLTAKNINAATLVGNSLGGHLALLFTLKHPDKVNSLVLAGSSGLFENLMGKTFPKRGNYDFVKEKVSETFYNKDIVTQELVDEVYEVTRSIPKSLRIVSLARSAQKNNLADVLHQICVPTLLLWGMNDTITPPAVAQTFKRLIPHSVIRFIDDCGHVPMMEQPYYFNIYLDEFLKKHRNLKIEA